MSFWDLDERAQLALLMAALVGTTTSASCSCVNDPPPRPFDADVRDFQAPDVLQPDTGPPTRDTRVDVMVADMVPPDAKPDAPPTADPLPPDAMSPNSSTPGRGTPPRRPALPLSRDFRTRIKAVTTLDHVTLTAKTRGLGNPALSHTWTISGGVLDGDHRQTVRWTPPTAPGRHMAQVVVRDGRGALAVDVYLYEVK